VKESLPCASCPAKCCGPIPLSTSRVEVISQHLNSMSKERIQQLKGQYRGPLTCRFVDTSDHSCAIYPVRPELCRNFGHFDKLICPVVGHIVDPVLTILADMAIESDTKDFSILSTEFTY
jgi:uncharacterized protein